MLTELQEKILKKLKDNLPYSATQAIELSDLGNIALVISATSELDSLGYVISACHFCGAAAILKDKGNDYFIQKNKQLYGEAYMEKIDLIDEFIDKAENMLSNKDYSVAKELINKFINVYANEIKNISIGMDAWNNHGATDSSWEKDLDLMICHLKNLKGQLSIDAKKNQNININPQFNPHFNQNLNNQITNQITISFDIVMDRLGESDLSDPDKDALRGMLADLEQQKKKQDKPKVWDKTKKLFIWIADKAIDVAVATWLIPYVATLFS